MLPLVSVIIPVYNSEKHLRETLESVILQEYFNLQIITVINGSTDSSLDIIEEIKDTRFLILKLEVNQGPVGAKNYGLKYAVGKYVQFLDSDDILSKNKIAEQVNLLEKNNNCISVCRTRYFVENSEINFGGIENEICTEFLFSTNSPLDFLLNLYGINGKDGMIQPNAFLIPSEIINTAGNYDERLKKSPDDDSEFMSRVIMNSKGIIYSKEGINYYRKIQNSNAMSNIRTIQSSMAALMAVELKFNYLISITNDNRLVHLYQRHLALIAYNYGRNHFEIIITVKMKLKKLNSNFQFRFGGKKFQIASKFLGFFNTLKIIFFLNKIRAFF